MQNMLISVCVLIVFFLFTVAMSALVIAGEADERNQRMFEEWMKTHGKEQEKDTKE